MKKIIFSSALLLVLFGCAASPPRPKMLTYTPVNVVIDYTGNDVHSAVVMAQQFCKSIEKNAQYVDTKKEGLWGAKKTAFFNCVALDSGHSNSITHP
jgi:ABC-type nitrate/sulfonate/bicarbonate transport system substrate-binding protein